MSKKKGNIIGEMVFNCAIILFILCFVLIDRNDLSCSNFNVQSWLVVVIGYYLLDLMMTAVSYHLLLKTSKESMCVFVVRFFFSWFIVGWLIYGNVKYYKVIGN